MKISKFALSAMIASACLGGTAFGQSNRTAPRYYPASYYSYQDGASTQAPAPITSASDSTTGTTASACCDNTPACDVAAICDGKEEEAVEEVCTTMTTLVEKALQVEAVTRLKKGAH